jgi:hypothetical protein
VFPKPGVRGSSPLRDAILHSDTIDGRDCVLAVHLLFCEPSLLTQDAHASREWLSPCPPRPGSAPPALASNLAPLLHGSSARLAGRADRMILSFDNQRASSETGRGMDGRVNPRIKSRIKSGDGHDNRVSKSGP